MSGWLRDLRIGARLAFAGGRTATLLTAIGVGLGVLMLLVAASVPHALDARDQRGAMRDDTALSRPIGHAGPTTLLIAHFDTEFHGASIYGRIVRAEGPRAPTPPGVRTLPGAGEAVVSPALARLLASKGGALLAARLQARVVGTIGDEGLIGPGELAFYLGSDQLVPGSALRTDRFGSASPAAPLAPMLALLVVTMFVALLLPIATFIATAVRFGGEQRERRLAALRLLGADGAMVRRIAAGEALVGALFGLLLGAAGFVVLRPLVQHLTLWDVTVFATDVRPGTVLAVLIALAVPSSAIGVTLIALRHVVIEPLGVVRLALGRRRRLLWRLALPAVGLLLLARLVADSSSGAAGSRYQAAAGATLLLVGVAALLPWTIEAVVLRLRGGGVSGQLAIRRLQRSSGTAARMVSGIAVATAGAIALQMLFAGVKNVYQTRPGQDGASAEVDAPYEGTIARLGPAGIDARLIATPGVRSARTLIQASAATSPGGVETTIYVAPCATLRPLLALDRCRDGESFVVGPDAAGPGQTLVVGSPEPGSVALPRWTAPTGAIPVTPGDEGGEGGEGHYATPGAIPAGLLARAGASTMTTIRLDPRRSDAADQLRTAAARIDLLATVSVPGALEEDRRFAGIRRGIYIGSAATLALIGASMLVAVLESLRQRRRLLAILVAFGTRRSTLAWSVLWQTLIPVLLGLLLAIGFGTALGSILLAMVNRPIRADPSSVAAICALGLALVASVTALSLPPLWRLMRPDGLRTE